jgi:hypothetical protein
VLDLYGARLDQGPISFRDWVASEYDNGAASLTWAEMRARRSLLGRKAA